MRTGAPLVGRQDVLAYLGGVLSRARSGNGSLVLVTGEPGIGKTRLAEELLTQADGFEVHWSWCTAERSTGSLRPWALVLRALAGRHAAVAERIQASPHLSGLLAGSATETGDPELARTLLTADLTDAVLAAAGETPLLVVLDDLHDAQVSTLRLLADLTAAIRGTSVVLLATARDGDLEWRGREQLRGELLGQAHRLTLAPLAADDIAVLLDDPAPERVQAVLDRTGGNPLLVTEMARSAEDVPATLRAMVSARTSTLPEPSRHVLEAAAVLGARFRLDVLADVTQASLQETGEQLAAAMAGALVTGDGPGRARFVHELLRDAVYADIPPDRQLQWHARAGEVLSALHQRGRDVAAAEVATHLLRSGSPAAGAAAQEAARSAAGMAAFDDAVRWYSEALATQADPAGTAGLLMERAHARRGCGDRDGARQDLIRAATIAPTAEVKVRAVLALGTGAGGFEVDALDGEQVQLLRSCLEALPDDALAQRAQVLARLSVASSRLADQAEVLRLAEDGVALARQSGDRIALAGALAALCDAIAGPDHVEARLAHSTEIVQLAGDAAEVELLGRRLRLVALLERGDRAAAEHEATSYEIRAKAVRHPLYLWYVPLWKGLWALAEGRYDECRQLTLEAERIGAGSANAYMLCITQKWCRLAQERDVAGSVELFEQEDLDSQLGVWAVVARALAYREQGREQESLAALDSVAAAVLELPRDSEWLAELAQASIVIEGHDHWLRPHLYDAQLPHADLFVVEGIGAAIRGPVHRFLAKVAPDEATAARHRAASDELCRRIGARALLSEVDRPAARATWRLDGDVWTLRWTGSTLQVRDSKGMRDLAQLLAAQGREIAALDLYGTDAPLEHDTGEVLDAAAREAYKRRLGELEQLDSLSEREAAERAALLEQLSAAYGLGGRVRRTGSSSERARSAVTARVRDTVRRIADLDADLGRHLSHSVRTGAFCSYAPEQRVEWDLTT